jgi:hypothetical protein
MFLISLTISKNQEENISEKMESSAQDQSTSKNGQTSFDKEVERVKVVGRHDYGHWVFVMHFVVGVEPEVHGPVS